MGGYGNYSHCPKNCTKEKMLLSYLHTMVVIAVLGMVLYNNRKIKATSTECETNPGPCPLRKKYMGYTASHLRSKGAIHNNPGSLQLQGP